MSFIADRVVMDGLTFDDVLLIPAYSEVLPRNVDLTTKFSRNITLNIPMLPPVRTETSSITNVSARSAANSLRTPPAAVKSRLNKRLSTTLRPNGRQTRISTITSAKTATRKRI